MNKMHVEGILSLGLNQLKLILLWTELKTIFMMFLVMTLKKLETMITHSKDTPFLWIKFTEIPNNTSITITNVSRLMKDAPWFN